MLIINGLTEAWFDLFRNVEVVEDRHFSCVVLDDACLFGGNECQVVFNFVIGFFVVHVYVFETRIEQVSQHGDGPSCFFEYQLWPFLLFLRFEDSIFPSLGQDVHLGVKLCHPLSFGNRSDNDTAVLRLDTIDELLEPCTFFSAFDFWGDRDFISERNQDDEASCEGQFACQTRSFCRDWFFDDLHQDLLAHGKHLLYTAIFLQVGKFLRLAERIESLPVTAYLFQVFRVRIELTA